MKPNFKHALYVLKCVKSNEHWSIGIVKDSIENLTSYNPGEIVLFRKDRDGTITMEAPMPMKEIRSGTHGALMTWKTIINVPRNYVKEIKIEMIDVIYDKFFINDWYDFI